MFTLEEAQAAIANKPEFMCNEREFGFVIDYNVAFAETFIGANDRETLILQNLRGTCFNHDGEIIRLAYHKFHNLNENAQYAAERFNFNDAHIIQEKLDGSMIAPIPNFGRKNTGWEFGTRAGVTEVADKAWALMASWIDTNPSKFKAYEEFINQCIADGLTPIFEFCSRAQRIVIDYPTPMLVLTDIRDNATGAYFDIYNKFYMSPEVDRVRLVYTSRSNISEFASVIKELKGEEGVVVKFSDGRFCKIKGDDYCMKHRALDGLRFEKDVLRLVLEKSVDDVLPLVTDEMKERLLGYQESVIRRLSLATQEMQEIFERNRHVATKKEFAELVMKSPYKTGLFKLWDGMPYSLHNHVLGKCGSSTAVEEVRWLIGKPWNEF